MKRITVTLALILCLVLAAFAFASCGKEKKPAGTTASGACAHEWGDYVVEVSATCSSVGMKVRYCKKCEAPDPETVEVPKLAHTESTDYKIISNPTCSDPGYKTKFCTACGVNLDETGEDIPADPKKHNVEVWSAVPTLLNPDVHRTGECTICHQTQEEDVTLSLEVQTFTPTTSRHQNKVLLSEIRGDKHFYPDETNGNLGNDLLIEYSVLWNDTLLNLDGSTKPYVTSRIANSSGTTQTSMCYFSPTENITGSDCKYAGGFETTGHMSSYSDGEVTSPSMSGNNYSSYPNLGGADQANPEWGWHRVGIRIHQNVTNLSAVMEDTTGATAAVYDVIVTLYIDGVPVSKLSGLGEGDKTNYQSANYLYSVKSDGKGGVTYEDNTNDGRYVFALLFDSNKPKSGTTAYWVDADVNYTCGQTFAQQVRKVASPAAKNFTLDDNGTPDDTADDVIRSGAIWYELAD